MKLIGIIGGMSWESSAEYYRLINEAVAKELGGFHSARTLMHSVDFAEIEQLQNQGRWDEMGEQLADVARGLERGGADFLLLATNTMHKVADTIEKAVNIPLLHIADSAAEAVKAAEICRVGLLGTRFTMEQRFYLDRLERHGLEALTPEKADRETIHRVIYEELCMGIVKGESREAYRQIMARLVQQGVGGIILGCTEIGLLVCPGDASVPLFDTTKLHVLSAVAKALQP